MILKQASRKKVWTWTLFALKGIVSISLLIFVMQRFGANINWNVIHGLSLSTITISCALLVFSIVCVSFRWLIVIHSLGLNFALGDALRITFLTQFFNNFLPSALTDLIRMWQTSQAGMTISDSISSILLERITYFASLSIYALLWIILYFGMHAPPLIVPSLAALAGISVLATFLLFFINKIPASWLPHKLAQYAHHLAADSRTFFRSGRSLTAGFLVLIAGQTGFATVFVLLGPSFGLEIDAIKYLAISPAIFLISALPISIAGWGVRELILVEFLTYLGAPPAGALQLSLAIGVLTIVASLPGAVVWIIKFLKLTGKHTYQGSARRYLDNKRI